jgi:hypothetical protein
MLLMYSNNLIKIFEKVSKSKFIYKYMSLMHFVLSVSEVQLDTDSCKI